MFILAKQKPVSEEKLSIVRRGVLNITDGEEPSLETALGNETLSEILLKLNGYNIELTAVWEDKKELE